MTPTPPPDTHATGGHAADARVGGVLVPSLQTRRLAARMTHLAREEGGDAVRLLGELDKGQEVALVAALLGLITGGGSHQRPGPASATHRRKVLDLIVCGTCSARVWETCRTVGGRTRADHPDRLFPRRCPCGQTIPKVKARRWCDQCRDAERKARQQRYDRARPTRNRTLVRDNEGTTKAAPESSSPDASTPGGPRAYRRMDRRL